jgi:hypothetical protein
MSKDLRASHEGSGAMDYLLRCEQHYRDHDARTAAINREGWKKPQPMARRDRRARVRTRMAQSLIALAMRLAPPLRSARVPTASVPL